MIKGLYSAATGMMAQSLNIDVISNNLANVNTTGFKKDRIDFHDLLYQVIKSPGASASQGNVIPTGLVVGSGTRPVAIQKIHTEGDLIQTQNQLDMAVEGHGYFQVLQPDGTTAYTRAGSWKLNNNGAIVNSDGLALQPAMTIPAGTLEVNVGSDGVVEAIDQAGAVTAVGNITLANFTNTAGLKPIGRNLLIETVASGAPVVGTPGLTGLGTIAQGFLENSNVRVIEEMVNMILAQRAYEVNTKVIQTSDEMLQLANSIKR